MDRNTCWTLANEAYPYRNYSDLYVLTRNMVRFLLAVCYYSRNVGLPFPNIPNFPDAVPDLSVILAGLFRCLGSEMDVNAWQGGWQDSDSFPLLVQLLYGTADYHYRRDTSLTTQIHREIGDCLQWFQEHEGALTQERLPHLLRLQEAVYNFAARLSEHARDNFPHARAYHALAQIAAVLIPTQRMRMANEINGYIPLPFLQIPDENNQPSTIALAARLLSQDPQVTLLREAFIQRPLGPENDWSLESEATRNATVRTLSRQFMPLIRMVRIRIPALDPPPTFVARSPLVDLRLLIDALRPPNSEEAAFINVIARYQREAAFRLRDGVTMMFDDPRVVRVTNYGERILVATGEVLNLPNNVRPTNEEFSRLLDTWKIPEGEVRGWLNDHRNFPPVGLFHATNEMISMYAPFLAQRQAWRTIDPSWILLAFHMALQEFRGPAPPPVRAVHVISDDDEVQTQASRAQRVRRPRPRTPSPERSPSPPPPATASRRVMLDPRWGQPNWQPQDHQVVEPFGDEVRPVQRPVAPPPVPPQPVAADILNRLDPALNEAGLAMGIHRGRGRGRGRRLRGG